MHASITVLLMAGASIALATGASATGARDARVPSGRLDLQLRLPGGDPYTEGSVTHIRLTTASGRAVDDTDLDVKPLLSQRLAPGRYRLHAYQRDCQGTCERLGNTRTPGCTRAIVIRSGKTLALRHVLVYDQPNNRVVCTIIPPGRRGATPQPSASDGTLAVSELRPVIARLRRASIELAVARESDSVALYTSTTTSLYRRHTALSIPLVAGTYRLLGAVRACVSGPGRCISREVRFCERRVRVRPGVSGLTHLTVRYAAKPLHGAMAKCRLGT
jgi:hypothetical protein